MIGYGMGLILLVTGCMLAIGGKPTATFLGFIGGGIFIAFARWLVSLGEEYNKKKEKK